MSDTQVPLVYFGKVPSRGDFVRCQHHPDLIQTLDRWLSRTMDMMSMDTRWKLVYDAALPVQFAFLGIRASVGLAGHLVPSMDGSGRRFPFVAAGSFEVAHPFEFLVRSPQVLSRLWMRMDQICQQATKAEDIATVQQQIAGSTMPIETSPIAYEASFTDFLEVQTIGGLEGQLAQALRGTAREMSLRQTLLALGLLLQPVAAQPHTKIDKGLMLPLVDDALYRPLVATLWLDLAARFFRRSDVELGLLFTRWQNRPCLLLSFNGAAPRALVAAFDPEVCIADNIDVLDADWVEGYIEETPAIKKLADYLRDPQLSLKSALQTFREAFLGE